MRAIPVVLLLAPVALPAQSVSYTWPNQACVQMLHCDSGCSACNVPESESPLLVGSNLSAVGVDVCPRSLGGGDNVLDTQGWTIQPHPDHRLALSGVALAPVSLDSLVIVHGAAPDGPQRLEVSLALNGEAPLVVADVAVPVQGNTVLIGLGTVSPGEGQVLGTWQVTFRAYLGSGGPWSLDAVHLVFQEAALATSLPEHITAAPSHRSSVVDLLGRAVDPSRAGARLSGRGVVMMP